MTNKHLKRSPTSYVTREMKIKTIRFQYTVIRMAKLQNMDNTKC